MDYFIDICGFLGAWLLVGGPLYQAALELKEQEIDHEGIDQVTSSVSSPSRISPWWWLIPPVGYLLNRRRSQAYRDAVMSALKPEQLKQTVVFLDKARGWAAVAAGAFFIAIKETWQLIELLDWPVVVFWILLVVMIGIVFGITAASIWRSEHVLADTKKAAGLEVGD